MFVLNSTSHSTGSSFIRESDITRTTTEVPRRQPHRRSGLATLPSMGAVP